MKESGKLLRISDQRSIYIIMNDDGSYVKDNIIRYLNIGANFEKKIINESNFYIDNGMLHVVDAVGNSKFHFPAIWIDTISMKIFELQELGILQQK